MQKILLLLCLIIVNSNCWGQFLFEGGPSFTDLTNCTQSSPSKTIHDEVRTLLKTYQQRGVNLVNIPVFHLDGFSIFHSPSLEKVGFKNFSKETDLFAIVCAQASHLKLAISVSLENLYQIAGGNIDHGNDIDPLGISADIVKGVVLDLGKYASKYQIDIFVNEISFSDSFIKAVSDACKESPIRYIRYFGDTKGQSDIFCSEDFATYPISPQENDVDALYAYQIARWRSASARIGHQNLMFGHAYSLGKKTGVLTAGGWGLTPGCQQNIAIYRAVQFAPQIYSFQSSVYVQPPFENIEDKEFVENYSYAHNLLPLLKKFASTSLDNKKIANLVIDTPDPPLNSEGMEIFETALLSSSAAITNSLDSAAFRLAVTYRKPLPNAEVYYIFTAGSSPKYNLYRDISDGLLPIFLQSKKRVFLQCALGLPRGPNWRKVAPKLGLPTTSEILTTDTKKLAQSPIPQYCNYDFTKGNFQTVPLRGHYFWINELKEAGKVSTFHHFSNISFRNLDSQVKIIATGLLNKRPMPVVTQKENFYFVNGNFLHLNFSNVLANLVADQTTYWKTSSIYLCRGKEQTAIFAADDTDIDLLLEKHNRIYHWKANGEPKPESSLKWRGKRLQGKMSKWELVITSSYLNDKSKNYANIKEN